MTNKRRNQSSEDQFVEIIEVISRPAGITPGGWFSRLVSEDYILTDYERKLREQADKKYRHPFSKRWIDPALVERERRHCAKLTAKRWEDTGTRLRGAVLIFATNGDKECRRAFTLWVGRDLVEKARTSRKPLAAILRDRLANALRKHLGQKQFGFWFHLDRTRTDPYAIHAHGIITIKDPSHFEVRDKRKALGKLMIDAAGAEHVFRTGKGKKKARLLEMHKANLNIGWIDYCRNSKRFKNAKAPSHRVLPADIGYRIEAWSGTLNAEAKAFYGRARILYNGIISGKAKYWTDDEWAKVADPNEI